MNTLDPGLVTLIASCVGALLFFCAGMFWNGRPEPVVEPMPSFSPTGGIAPVARLSANANSNLASDLGPELGASVAEGKGASDSRMTSSLPLSGVRKSAGIGAQAGLAGAKPRRSITPSGARRNGTPVSLRAALEQLTGRLDASSTLVLDEDGLLFTEGRDAHGVGACLCELLAAQAQLPTDNPRFVGARAFELGTLRLQQIETQKGPKAWLAVVGAERFATKTELQRVGRALTAELAV